MATPRILVLSTLYPKTYNSMSGVFAHQQVKHLIAAGADIRVVTGIPWAPRILWRNQKWRRYGESPPSRVYENVQISYPRYMELPGSSNFSWSGVALYYAVRKLVMRLYHEQPFDLIHANTIVPDGFAGVWLAAKLGVPCLCVSRGDLNIYPYYGPMSMRASCYVLRSCSRLVTVSADLAAVARRLEPAIKADIDVVYNGCDHERFHPVTTEQQLRLREKLQLPRDQMLIFILGAIEENKGVFELLEIYRQLLTKWNDKIHLVVIGSGRHESEFRQRLQQMHLQDRITMAGYLEHRDIPFWIQACDLMIFPTHYEGVPNAIIETMACGKPVVASRVGGIPEIITDGRTGYLANVGDIETFTTRLDRLVANEPVRRAMGEEAMRFIQKHASWPANAARLLDIYRNTLQAKGQ